MHPVPPRAASAAPQAPPLSCPTPDHALTGCTPTPLHRCVRLHSSSRRAPGSLLAAHNPNGDASHSGPTPVSEPSLSPATSSINRVDELSVARVAVDMPLPHLDRFFDYSIPAEFAADVVPGCRVKVRFSGRQRDGFVIDLPASSDSDRELSPLLKVTSSEPVLKPEVVAVVRAVADHYAGTFADVVRLAVPPRHGLTEKAAPAQHPQPNADQGIDTLGAYPYGAAFAGARCRRSAAARHPLRGSLRTRQLRHPDRRSRPGSPLPRFSGRGSGVGAPGARYPGGRVRARA